jgi:peptidoglycan/LPS O-acetylase OafA/YrhL
MIQKDLPLPTTAAGTTTVRRVAGIMMAVAATLAVASVLHLSGVVVGRGAPYNGDGAGIGEAVIGAVLVAGALAMLRRTDRARGTGIAAVGFATAGFLVGLSITARGGHWPDIAYHLAVLPVLIGSLVVLIRGRRKPG